MILKINPKVLFVAMFCCGSAFAADDIVMRAMRDELARSMKKLQLENLQKPYFISYRAVETSGCSASASFGALTFSSCEPRGNDGFRGRTFSLEVRVGDYSRDNTNFYSPLNTAGVVRTLMGGGMAVPLDDNYDEIRRQLWLGTDSAYKNALDVYAKKKAALENRTRTADAPDFSHEPQVTDEETAPAGTWTQTQVEDLVKSLSKLFRETPGIDNSEVRFSDTVWLTRYVNSEGTSFTRQARFAQLTINADTQALDGMPVSDVEAIYARSWQDLPSRDELVKRVRTLQSRLENIRKASLLERYTGPVLFEGQAAGEIFLQGVASRLTGVPRLVVDDLRFQNAFNSNGGLADRIGGRILPDFLSITDNPKLREIQGQPLFGGYQVDDDGVKAGPTVLVDKGVLKTLLHTRALIPETTQSTASRRGSAPMPSNLLFTTDKGLPADQLKAELLRQAKQRGKDYGIIVRRMGNPTLDISLNRSRTIIITSVNAPGSIQVEPLVEAYKVYPDGHEELVRNLEINGLTLGAFKDVVAVSDAPLVYTAPIRQVVFSPSMALNFTPIAGPGVVSMTIPSVLFDEMTLQRPTGDVPNLPVVKHPFFESK
jgi:predicted Zn-dependent protease